MISLSSDLGYKYDERKKVIKLKPIPFEESPEIADPNTAEEQMKTLDMQIKEAEKRLKQLEKTYKNQELKLQEKIKKQRAAWDEEKLILIEEAKEKGYKEGFAYGEQKSMEKYAETIDYINQLANKALKDYESTVSSSSEKILQIAIQVSEKILGRKLKEDSSSFLSIVETALDTLNNSETISIYVHPKNYELLLKQKKSLVGYVDGQANIQIFIDKDLSETSCIIEHPFGQVDASIDTQLNEIHKVLQNINNGE